MEAKETINERGMEFIKLFHIPINYKDYYRQKIQIDRVIIDLINNHKDDLEELKWEMLNTFPGSSILSQRGSLTSNKIMSSLLSISDEDDKIPQVICSDTFRVNLSKIDKSINEFLIESNSFENIELVNKVCLADISSEYKLIIGLTINPESYLQAYKEYFPNMQFNSADDEIIDELINYAKNIKKDKSGINKLYSLVNVVISGYAHNQIKNMITIIDESIDENNNFSELIAMEKINLFFDLKQELAKK